jgi:hypothetical protein
MLRLGESWFKARLGKKNVRSHLNRKKLRVVASSYHSKYDEKHKLKITVQASQEKNVISYFPMLLKKA